MAYVRGAPGQQSIWLRQTATGSDAPVLPTASVNCSGLAFTPDGDFIYYDSATMNASLADLYLIPTLGGNPKKIAEAMVGRVAVSPNGKRIAFGRWNPATSGTCLVVANSDGSAQRTLASGKMLQDYVEPNPAWSPDGKVIAIWIKPTGPHRLPRAPRG